MQLRIVVLVLVFCCSGFAQRPDAPPQAKNSNTYLLFYRTPGQLKYGKEKTFQQVYEEIQQLLTANGVTFVQDELRDSAVSTQSISLSSMLNMTTQSGAKYLLYFTFDRPQTKFVKITAQCFDTSGKKFWEELAQENTLSAGGSLKKNLSLIKDRLKTHVGHECLEKI